MQSVSRFLEKIVIRNILLSNASHQVKTVTIYIKNSMAKIEQLKTLFSNEFQSSKNELGSEMNNNNLKVIQSKGWRIVFIILNEQSLVIHASYPELTTKYIRPCWLR